MQPYHPPLEGRAGLRLDFNENTCGCSPRALAALRAMSAADLARYPEYGPARRSIAAHFGLDVDSVVLTNGVDDAIFLVLATFADPGEPILIAEPTFAMYRFYGERAGLIIRALRYQDRASLDGQAGRELILDPEELERALAGPTPPRVVLLANPNNPTGTWIPADAILALVAGHRDTLFFVDEAYADFAPDTAGLLQAVCGHPNLAVARTFSKAHGLAALRLGMLCVPPALVPDLRRAHAPYSVNAAALVCAVAALEDRDWLEQYRRQTVAGRRRLEATLSGLGLTWWRSHANFVLFRAERAGDPRPAQELVRWFRQQGILVRDRGRDVPGTVRITCGGETEISQAITVLEEYYGSRDRENALPRTNRGPELPVAVFDMDGVLVDVRGSYRRAIAATVVEFGGPDGAPVSVEEIQNMKDGGGYNNDWELTRELLRRRGILAEPREVIRTFNRLYHGHNGDGFRRAERWLPPPAALAAWRRKFRLAIFTGRPREEAMAALAAFGTAGSFAACVGMEDVTQGKPAPDGLLHLASRFAPQPLAVFLGDTVDDALAASAAGVPFIGILPPGHPRPQALAERFEEVGCIGVAANLTEALGLLASGDRG